MYTTGTVTYTGLGDSSWFEVALDRPGAVEWDVFTGDPGFSSEPGDSNFWAEGCEPRPMSRGQRVLVKREGVMLKVVRVF